MESGTIVSIFEDPITGTKLEGKARLIREYNPDEGDGLSMWIVQFDGDLGEPEVLRTININNCNPEE